MAWQIDLRTIKPTSQLFSERSFNHSLQIFLHKAATETIDSDLDDKADFINDYWKHATNMLVGDTDEKKMAIDYMLGEWDHPIQTIYPSPSPVTPTPPPKTDLPAVSSKKRVDDKGFSHPTKVCKLNPVNDKVNEIKLDNKFSKLSDSTKECTEVESQNIVNEKVNFIPKPLY